MSRKAFNVRLVRYLERPVEPDFQLRLLVELEVAVGQQTCTRTHRRAGAGTDHGAVCSARSGSGSRANGCAAQGGLNHALLAGALLDLAFIARGFHTVFTRQANDRP